MTGRGDNRQLNPLLGVSTDDSPPGMFAEAGNAGFDAEQTGPQHSPIGGGFGTGVKSLSPVVVSVDEAPGGRSGNTIYVETPNAGIRRGTGAVGPSSFSSPVPWDPGAKSTNENGNRRLAVDGPPVAAI